MKRNGFVSAVMIAMGMIVLGSGMCFAEMKFIVNANPVAFLISPDADEFSASTTFVREEIEGNTSLMPTLVGGVEFDTKSVVYAVTAGGGYLYNEAFTSPLVQADGAVRFKIWNMEIGPHVGVLYFMDPEWDGTATISLDESVGIFGGISLTAGWEWLKFLFTADYVNGDFDVTGSGFWRPNKNEIDYTGFLGQVGVIFRF